MTVLDTKFDSISPRPPSQAQSDQSISHLSPIRTVQAASVHFQPDRVSISRTGQQLGAMFADAEKLPDAKQRQEALTNVASRAHSSAGKDTIHFDIEEIARKNQRRNQKQRLEIEYNAKKNKNSDRSEMFLKEAVRKGHKDIVQEFKNLPKNLPDGAALAKEKPKNLTERYVAANSDFAIADSLADQNAKSRRVIQELGQKLKAESKARWDKAIKAAQQNSESQKGQNLSLAA